MKEFSGFYKLSVQERMEKVKKAAGISDEEAKVLMNGGALGLERADKMVENVIGAIHLPLGIGTNFVINGKEHLVPMAVEEASVIAAASRAAKQTLPEGFKAEADEQIMIGQILLVGVEDTGQAMKNIELNKKEILAIGAEQHTLIECILPFHDG